MQSSLEVITNASCCIRCTNNQLVLDEILCCPCTLICKGRCEYIKLLILTNIE